MNKSLYKKTTILALTIAIQGFFVHAVVASGFYANNIITDDDMTDYSRMSATAIQSFLSSKGGILSTYQTVDVDGVNKSAAEIIYNVSYRYRLNPQFLISHIQKESSLITGHNSNLLDWALGYGVCDSCSKDHPSVIKYKGFAKQMDAAGNQFRNGYLSDLESRNSTISGWGVGIGKYTLDGVLITPSNKATAVLYTYTPWVGYHGGDANVGGNSLFYDIMERYFPGRTSRILEYPDSTLFQDVATGSVYKLDAGKIRPITSYTALLSNYDPSRIVLVDEIVLDRYQKGDPIFFPKFIYVQSPQGGVFLIDQDHKKRAITSREAFRSMGVNPEEVIPLTQDAIDAIPENPPITTSDRYPIGGLIQNKDNGAVMYLDTQASLHPVWSKEIMDNRFKGLAVNSENAQVFNEYPVKQPVKFSNGTLLKIPERDKIYVIDDGKKRPVESSEVLDSLGGFESVTTTSKSMLKLHETGNALKFKKSTKKKKKKKKN
ncbi:MAG: hypothetical protein Q8P90_03565 [bacterium]|nr:hypothetical protein [bacterium]